MTNDESAAQTKWTWTEAILYGLLVSAGGFAAMFYSMAQVPNGPVSTAVGIVAGLGTLYSLRWLACQIPKGKLRVVR